MKAYVENTGNIYGSPTFAGGVTLSGTPTFAGNIAGSPTFTGAISAITSLAVGSDTPILVVLVNF